jgi:hypothetical protein
MKKLQTEYVFLWYVLSAVMIALLVFKWPGRHGELIFSCLGGIEENGKTIMLLPMGKWLLSYGYFFLIAGIEIRQAKKMCIFSLQRYGTFSSWWRRYFFRIQNIILLLYFEMIFIWRIIEWASGQKTRNAFLIIFTFYLHLSMMISLELCSDLIWEKDVMAAALIVIEGICYIVAEEYKLPWMAGGMYVRSEHFLNYGFQLIAVYVMESVVIVVCYTLVWILWKKGIGVQKIGERKDD